MKIIKYKYNKNDVYVNYNRVDAFVIREDGKIIMTFADDTGFEYFFTHTGKREEFVAEFESWLYNGVVILDGLTLIEEEVENEG